MNSRSTFNKNELPLPLLELRVKEDDKVGWEELSYAKKQMLQAYQVTVELISRISGTELDTLRHILMYEYYFPSSVVEDLIRFITTNETKHIEFEEGSEYVN